MRVRIQAGDGSETEADTKFRSIRVVRHVRVLEALPAILSS